MKNGIPGLVAAALLACCSLAFATDAEMDMNQGTVSGSAKPSSSTESMPMTESTRQYTGEEIRTMEPRPKDLDLRYCLELKDAAAIAKCAGE